MDQISTSTPVNGYQRLFFPIRQLGFCTLFCSLSLPAFAQNLQGRVFDLTTGDPIPNVTVENKTSGNQSRTGTSGAFSISVRPGDSIRFSMLSYISSMVLIPQSLQNTILRNIYLSKNYFTIPGVAIQPDLTAYQKDSIEERIIFGKKAEQKQARFGMEKPKYMRAALIFSNPVSAPFQHFSPRYKRLRAFQKRFIQNEQQGFVETRYTLALIRRITGLQGDSLIAFRNQNPLPYGFACGTDMEIMMWIKDRFKEWLKNPFVPQLADSLFDKEDK